MPIGRPRTVRAFSSIRKEEERERASAGKLNRAKIEAEREATGKLPSLPKGWSWHPCFGCKDCENQGDDLGNHWETYWTSLLTPTERAYAGLLMQMDGQPAKPSSDVRARLTAQAMAIAKMEVASD